QVAVERWPGQLRYEQLRAERCARTREYVLTYLNAFDESGTLALWAEVPQELEGAELRYQVVERVTPKPPPPAVAEAEPRREVEPAPPPKPRPPMPEPKREEPDPAEDAAAVWQPGHWRW